MGNCVETCTQQHPLPLTAGKDSGGGGGIQIKVVLTKEELEWLLLQLRATDAAATTTANTPMAARLGSQSVLGNNKLEEFLMVIERARRERIGKSNAEVSWKPSLGSITEAPESLEMDRS
ncbi:hypothetical protein MLD38_010843 [Melastoma candidum]|uniref:Uncharacterized protein n=1 Tax=Melastoma candidum TaxID=119954 RepID=A0ACB9R177_9MYRT|nr:hypothetical protein MLD38_010843 [Melastoma candidum]